MEPKTEIRNWPKLSESEQPSQAKIARQRQIDPCNPDTAEGRQLFPIVKAMLEEDSAYVERLKKHYQIFKTKFASQNPEASKIVRDPRIIHKDTGLKL